MLGDQLYDRAMRIWIARREGLKEPDKVYDITFEDIHHGYCETCDFTTVGITYAYEGKDAPRMGDVDIEYLGPAVLIREVSQIIQELREEDSGRIYLA